jgi:hypothetical protein
MWSALVKFYNRWRQAKALERAQGLREERARIVDIVVGGGPGAQVALHQAQALCKSQLIAEIGWTPRRGR